MTSGGYRGATEQDRTAMAAGASGGDLVLDARSGVYGHRVTMLDFSAAELERFRRIGPIVGFDNIPGEVETALAPGQHLTSHDRLTAVPTIRDYMAGFAPQPKEDR